MIGCALSERPRVVAVIVTFHPQIEALSALLGCLFGEAITAYVVDNGSDEAVVQQIREFLEAGEGGHLLALGENRGIAAGQNLGIQRALEEGAEFVLFLDQDSEPEGALLEGLMTAYEALASSGQRVAAVAPWLQDPRLPGFTPFNRLSGLRRERYHCQDAAGPFRVDYLFSSGMLVPTRVLAEVGMMNEELFIDYVDAEWCFRAARKGYACFGACSSSMRHRLGDAPARFLWRRFTMRSPVRNYYYFRNAIYMYRSGLPSNLWKIRDGLRVCVQAVLFLWLGDRKRERLRMIVRGLRDGFTGRGGSL